MAEKDEEMKNERINEKHEEGDTSLYVCSRKVFSAVRPPTLSHQQVVENLF